LDIDYLREPVDPETFLFDPYYLGEFGKYLYDKWVEVLLEILDPQNHYYELIATGCIGSGKTTVACFALAYKLYLLSCLRSPSAYFGLMPGTPVLLGIYNIFKYKAEDVHSILKHFIEQSPYFQQHAPTLKMRNRLARDGLIFDHGVQVINGSTELHALGLNLFSIALDEANFMRVPNIPGGIAISQAQKLYTAVQRRLENRYQYKGVVPGLMILISSRNVETSWLENHIALVRDKPGTFIADYALWDVKREVMGYSGKTFQVEVGDAISGSRILEDGELPREGSRVVEVPVEHRASFDADVENALRDIAGVATLAHSLFVRHREHVRMCVDPSRQHPFTRESVVLSDKSSVKLQDYLKWRDLVTVKNSIVKPKLNPMAVRHVHVDLAERHDCVGITMGHVSSTVGNLPRICIDFMLRIQPPKQGSIDFSKIREFIIYLRDQLGYPIKSVSFDSFQCLTPNTIVPLVDGRNLTLQQILDEYGTDRSFSVYSFDRRNNCIVEGEATHLGVVGKNCPVYRVTLDDGSFYDCTSNHEWILKGGERRKTSDLKPGDSLEPLNRIVSNKDSGCDGYEMVFQPNVLRYKYTHVCFCDRLISATNMGGKLVFGKKNGKQTIRHHLNFNKRDNRRENLVWMNFNDHFNYHSEVIRERFNDPMFLNSLRRGIEKCRAKVKEMMKDPVYRENFLRRRSEASKKGTSKKQKDKAREHCLEMNERLWNDPEWVARRRLSYSEAIRQCWKDPIYRRTVIESIAKTKATKSKDEWARMTERGLKTKTIAAKEKMVESGLDPLDWDISRAVLISKGASVQSIPKFHIAKRFLDFNHKVTRVAFLKVASEVHCLSVGIYRNFAVRCGNSEVFTGNSSDSRQIMEKLGFQTSIISVDRTDEAYQATRQVIYEHRVEFYDYQPMIQELLGLVYDGERKKVDHVDHQSKDISDSFASVVFYLSRALGQDKGLGRVREARELLPMTGQQLEAMELMEKGAR
jgi:hypothetical protein